MVVEEHEMAPITAVNNGIMFCEVGKYVVEKKDERHLQLISFFFLVDY